MLSPILSSSSESESKTTTTTSSLIDVTALPMDPLASIFDPFDHTTWSQSKSPTTLTPTKDLFTRSECDTFTNNKIGTSEVSRSSASTATTTATTAAESTDSRDWALTYKTENEYFLGQVEDIRFKLDTLVASASSVIGPLVLPNTSTTVTASPAEESSPSSFESAHDYYPEQEQSSPHKIAQRPFGTQYTVKSPTPDTPTMQPPSSSPISAASTTSPTLSNSIDKSSSHYLVPLAKCSYPKPWYGDMDQIKSTSHSSLLSTLSTTSTSSADVMTTPTKEDFSTPPPPSLSTTSQDGDDDSFTSMEMEIETARRALFSESSAPAESPPPMPPISDKSSFLPTFQTVLANTAAAAAAMQQQQQQQQHPAQQQFGQIFGINCFAQFAQTPQLSALHSQMPFSSSFSSSSSSSGTSGPSHPSSRYGSHHGQYQQHHNPFGFGQQHSSAAPGAPAGAFASTSAGPSGLHSSSSMASSFPMHLLASMNQAAAAAAAAANAANGSTTNNASSGFPMSGPGMMAGNNNNQGDSSAFPSATTATNPAQNFAAQIMSAAAASSAWDGRFILPAVGTIGRTMGTSDHHQHGFDLAALCAAAAASTNSTLFANKDDLELKAKDHREAASRVNECESVYSITRFEIKPPHDAIYSTKVFLGGVPWDMNNDDMMEVFRPFGAEAIQRPGKDVRLSRASQGLDKAGYLYIIFDSDAAVNRLINACKLELSEAGHRYFYTLTSKHSKKDKRVQVIPWNTADSACILNPLAKADQSRTVFLGALHGMMNAQAIAKALTLIFGHVEYVALDTDKYKYPMGSGRAMFVHREAYLKAVNAGFVRVKSERFEKTIQIDQFLDDRMCYRCFYEKGPVFCKGCQKYYCKACWNVCHMDEMAKKHPILMKTRLNSKF